VHQTTIIFAARGKLASSVRLARLSRQQADAGRLFAAKFAEQAKRQSQRIGPAVVVANWKVAQED
jgi:hypothetical protein